MGCDPGGVWQPREFPDHSEIQAVVPEPSSVALVASGMLVLALLYRRRRADSVIAILFK